MYWSNTTKVEYSLLSEANFLGSAVNLFKNEFAPSESADKKGASTPMGESSEDVIREEEIAKGSILTYLKSDQQQGYLVKRFLLLPLL